MDKRVDNGTDRGRGRERSQRRGGDRSNGCEKYKMANIIRLLQC